MKKLLPLLLSLSLLATPIAALAEGHGTAYAPSEWAVEAIDKADAAGIIPDGFSTEWAKPVTRAEFCTLAYNLIASIGTVSEAGTTENPFIDTDNTNVLFLHALGIINGKSEIEFAPNDLLTREEAATILCRMADVLGIDIAAVHDIAYIDDAEIADWAKDGVYRMNTLGIMQGTDKGFEPKVNYTVEQSIVTLMRLSDKIATSAPAEDVDNFTDRINALMPDNENYMFSPLSIQMALALAANGAEGETQTELLNAADIADIDEFNAEAKAKIERYSKAEILKLNVANSIWINTSKTNSRFSDSYKTRLAEYYAAEAGMVDDTTAVDTINGWVSEKTNSKITTIIDDSNFWAMLINAVYFKGAWQNEFEEFLTAKDIFHNADGTTAETDFMNDTGWYSYCNINGAGIITLPYKNSENKISEDGMFVGSERYDDLNVSMYVILSDGDVNPQAAVKAAVDGSKLERTYVKLSIPKFEFDYSTGLNDILRQLGIEKSFTSLAEFAPMLDSGNMQITDSIHKTYIKVDEKGTEAAAVTRMMMAGSALSPEPIEFKADKPFTFVIYNHSDDTVLFVGRYAQAK